MYVLQYVYYLLCIILLCACMLLCIYTNSLCVLYYIVVCVCYHSVCACVLTAYYVYVLLYSLLMCLAVCMYANSMYVYVLYYISMFAAALTSVLRKGQLLYSCILCMQRADDGYCFFVAEPMAAYKCGCRRFLVMQYYVQSYCWSVSLACYVRESICVYGNVCVCDRVLYYATTGEIKERTLTMFILYVLQ